MRRLAVALALVTVGLVASPPVARAATHHVRVEDNVFVPEVLAIEPGDTVTWTATRGGHTITADDGRFDFPRDRMTELGDQLTWRFEAEEVVRYYCRIHGGPGGQGMAGVIRVGDPARPTPPAAAVDTIVVPDDVATIGGAVAGARPGTQVLVRPGVYPEEIDARVPGVVIRGVGAGPDEVVLRGDHHRAVGVRVTAANIRIENLAITGYRDAGITVGAVSGTVVDRATLHANGLYGIDARGVAGMTVRDVHISGHGIAGVGVRDCEACGARIDGSRLERNAAGFVAVAATGVVLRGTQVNGNAVGVVLRDAAGARLSGNTIVDNDSPTVWVAAIGDGSEVPSGAGVWLMGGRDIVVASNTVTGHTYNVAVTGPPPALRHRIVGNTAGGALHADLGWDGLGAGVCFRGNRQPRGGAATTDLPAPPPSGCDSPATVGLPNPLIWARLVAHAHGRGHPA